MPFPIDAIRRLRSSGRQLRTTAVVTMAALALGAVAVYQPLLAIGLVVVAVAAFGVLARPDATVLMVVFIVYTNAAVVAVKFHGLPSIVGILVPLLLVVPLTYHLVIRRQTVIVTSALPLIGLFLVVQTLSALFSSEPDVALQGLTVYLVEGAGLYFVITNVVRTRAVLRQVTWALLFAGICMGGLSGYQQITKTFDKTYGGFAQANERGFGVETDRGRAEQRRLAGPIGEQNRYAQIMLMLVPLGLFRFWSEPSFWWRTLALVATALAGLGAVLTFSRGGAVGFGLLLVLMAVMGYLRPRQLVVITVGLAVLLVAVPQFGFRMVSLQSLAGLAGNERVEVSGSFRGRATEMLAAVRVFADYPILGVGPGRFKYYSAEYGNKIGLRVLDGTREAHSLYPAVAAENGVLGLVCFLGILFVTLRDLVRVRRSRLSSDPDAANTATGFMLAVAAYMTTGLFLHFSYIRYFWLMLALAGSAAYVADPASRIVQRKPGTPLPSVAGTRVPRSVAGTAAPAAG